MNASAPSTEPVAAADEALRWRFGECLLDEGTLELHVGGEKQELPRKPLELLMFFVRNPDEVLTREELFEAVWPGRIVSENSLTNAIGRLRSVLRDKDQQLIKSVYGYGYRFTGVPVRDSTTPIRTELAPALDFADGDPVPQREGWVLRRRLGAGGSGEAWLGQHLESRDTRVFKFARDRGALSALKREITLSRLMREALGERADLVRVLDWSLDTAPFFIAIEYCGEGSLVDWCERQGGLGLVPLDLRLEWLAQAADALAAAHSVGVLHKDLKPSNLLLHKTADDVLMLKLADFGSARLIDRNRLLSHNITQFGFTQTLADTSSGTPAYLAPELFAGSPATTRSDVFALGVMLYQLVVGDLRRALAPGWEHDVGDPLLIQDIGEAAAGDPQRRLADAAQLAARLRSLPARRAAHAREQVAALAAQATRRALDRSRARRGMWIALTVVSLMGFALTLWQFLGARQSEARASRAAQESEAVAAFLIDDVLAAADPLKQSRQELTVKAMLDRATAHLAERLQDQPSVRARIGLGLAQAYDSAGDYAGQRQQLEQALKDAERAEGRDGRTTLKIDLALAGVIQTDAQYERAESLYEKVLANSTSLGASDPLILDALAGRAYLEYERGNFAEAARRYESYRERLSPADDAERITEVNSYLPDVYIETGRFKDAESMIRKAIADQGRQQGSESGYVDWLRVTLGHALLSQQRWDEAETELKTAVDGLQASVGPEHPYTLGALSLYGKLKLLRGDAAAALPLIERDYLVHKRLRGDDHAWTQYSAANLGRVMTQVGRAAEAVPLLETSLKFTEQNQGPKHPVALAIRASLAEALFKSGNPARARLLMTEAQPWAEQVLLPGGERSQRFRQVLDEVSRETVAGTARRPAQGP